MPAPRPDPTLEQLVIEAVQLHLLRQRGPGYFLTFLHYGMRGPDGLESEWSLHPANHFPFHGEPLVTPQTADRQEPPTGQTGQTSPVRRTLTRTMQAIVDVLRTAEAPLKGAAIARRARKTWNGHFRGVLAQMQTGDDPILIRVDDGYWLADRPLDRAETHGDAPDAQEE